MNRRAFLRGAVALAPAVILTPGLLMPVRSLNPARAVGEMGKFMGFNFVETVYVAGRRCGKTTLTAEFVAAYAENLATLMAETPNRQWFRL